MENHGQARSGELLRRNEVPRRKRGSRLSEKFYFPHILGFRYKRQKFYQNDAEIRQRKTVAYRRVGSDRLADVYLRPRKTGRGRDTYRQVRRLSRDQRRILLLVRVRRRDYERGWLAVQDYAGDKRRLSHSRAPSAQFQNGQVRAYRERLRVIAAVAGRAEKVFNGDQRKWDK